ncbi:MAG: type II secretion system GspH family protein [Planctomycetia bacterium]|nr:type II secretion system GspH family protein [Planctomycetia bacterium]
MPTANVRQTRHMLTTAHRSGFTLVELLAVVLIIAILAALVTPAVMRARNSARNAAVKAEIDMLHMAMMNYKNEYGSFPPSADAVLSTASPAGRHLLRLFPRLPSANVNAQLVATGTTLSAGNALAFWLLGYTTNPTSPLMPTKQRQKLFDFDVSRVDAQSGAYAMPGKPGSPYIYVVSGTYGTISGTATNVTHSFASQSYTAQVQVLKSSTTFFNPDTFQILCAGQDETWGTDDDLSNFWKGTRKEYTDSLQ